MFLFLIVFIVPTNYVVRGDSVQIKDTSAYVNGEKIIKQSDGALSFYAAVNSNTSPVNLIYFEKDVNQVKVPTSFYEEHKKKKKIKKLPKRTIQKIIKKGKNRSRKIYVRPMTRVPTAITQKYEMQDSDGNYEESTTENNKRRYRKNSKIPRYPMPFQKFQRNSYIRNKRESDRKNLYIINDLDEIEFVDRGDDCDVVKAHVANYW